MHTPDLYEGSTFAELVDGQAYVESVGFRTILDRSRAATATLPD